MAWYLAKILITLLFCIFTMLIYYVTQPSIATPTGLAHSFSDGYTLYAIIIAIIYGSYKIFHISLGAKRISFSFWQLGLGLILHLGIIAYIFSYWHGGDVISGILLWIKILWYTLLPIVLVTCILAIGKKTIDLLFGKQEIFSQTLVWLMSLVTGFYLYITLLSIAGFIWLYDISTVYIITLLFAGVWYRQIGEISRWLKTKITFNSHHTPGVLWKIQTQLLSAELFYFVITLVISIALISIMRPFPVGWDDLGVYMNFPKLMAMSGEVWFLGTMLSWSVFTGIGYLFENPTQAFFLNSVWSLLSVVVIMAIVSDIFNTTKDPKHTFIHIPTLLAMIFISLPMIMFQFSKDMKIDPGLFFMSIIIVYMLYITLLNSYSSRHTYILYGLIWLLSWFVFTIKFTSLLLIIGLAGTMFFRYLWWSGLLGYLAWFIAIFTKFGFWKYMNVSFPHDDVSLRNQVFIWGILIAGWALAYAWKQDTKKALKWVKYIAVFFLFVCIGILPWAANNVIRSGWDVSVSTLLSWKTDHFIADYSLIYSPEKIADIKQNSLASKTTTSSGVTHNEDLWRYFWYEEGLNNYLKLPWNLTMQLNEWRDFTNISWIFFAFLPVLFLFLPVKNRWFYAVILGLLALEICLYFWLPTRIYLSGILADITLPEWYGVLLIGAGLVLSAIMVSLNTKKSYIKIFLYNLVFSAIYILLWAISSFGIVWYGIVMYFNMLLMIGIALHYLSSHSDWSNSKENIAKFFGSTIILLLISVLIALSVFPYMFKSLYTTGYIEFKKWEVTHTQAVLSRQYNDALLFELNVGEHQYDAFIETHIDPILLERIPVLRNGRNITLTINTLKQLQSNRGLPLLEQKMIETSLQNIYNGILQPTQDLQNSKNIYRVGTFLKYHIIKNNARIMEDGLLNKFHDYIYDASSTSREVSRIKSLGMDYIIFDLGAATIDNDPGKRLVARTDAMFEIFTDPSLSLVASNSVCFKLAGEVYVKNQDLQEYLILATAWKHNSSYGSSGQKLATCRDRLYEIITTQEISAQNYPSLIWLAQYIEWNNMRQTQEIRTLIAQITVGTTYAVFKLPD